MYSLSIQESLIDQVQKAIEEAQMDDVTVHPPFLGKAVIRCSRESSAAMLRSKVDGLRAA
ncbi:MAG: hypothetical protein WA840_06350 [Caulobacteraceae bacterium]